jgi:hypothetical protein
MTELNESERTGFRPTKDVVQQNAMQWSKSELEIPATCLHYSDTE